MSLDKKKKTEVLSNYDYKTRGFRNLLMFSETSTVWASAAYKNMDIDTR